MSNTATEVELAIITKIEALFRQANHPNTGQIEREAFQAKAFALMTKHRISHVDVDAKPNQTPEDVLFGLVPGSYSSAQHMMVEAVAQIFACRTWYRPSGRPGDPARTIFVFGFKADCDKVIMMARLFIEDAKLQASAHKTNKTDDTIAWRKAFMQGYAVSIRERFQEAKTILADEQADWETTGGALVLVERAVQVTSAFETKSLRKAARSRQTFSHSGYAAGQEAGRNSNIGRGRVGKTRKALS